MSSIVKQSINSDIFNIIKFNNHEIKLFKTDFPYESKTEVHLSFYDLYIVISGEANLLSSKTYSEGYCEKEGEIRDCKIEQADEVKIEEGDVVLIPCGIAHQITVISDKFKQLVIKIPKDQ